MRLLDQQTSSINQVEATPRPQLCVQFHLRRCCFSVEPQLPPAGPGTWSAETPPPPASQSAPQRSNAVTEGNTNNSASQSHRSPVSGLLLARNHRKRLYNVKGFITELLQWHVSTSFSDQAGMNDLLGLFTCFGCSWLHVSHILQTS